MTNRSSHSKVVFRSAEMTSTKFENTAQKNKNLSTYSTASKGRFLKKRALAEVEHEQACLSPDGPQISGNAIACRFPSIFKSAAVLVDTWNGQIHFKNCHVPWRFLARAEPWFSCPISAIKALHIHSHKGEFLTIVTPTGTARIPARSSENCVGLRNTMEQMVPQSQPGFSMDDPMMGFVFLFGALMGVAFGFFFGPSDSNDATLAVVLLVGAVLGGMGSYLVV